MLFRSAPDRYYMTTTTGGAAHVLGWMERWRQTEWPDLKVYFTSLTDQWVTIAVSGPNARGRAAPHTATKMVPISGTERGNGNGASTGYSPKAPHFRARDPLNSPFSAAFRQLSGSFSCYRNPFPVTPFGASEVHLPMI